MCKKQLLTSHHERKKVKLYHKSVFSNLFSCPSLLLCRAAVPKSLFFVIEQISALVSQRFSSVSSASPKQPLELNIQQRKSH